MLQRFLAFAIPGIMVLGAVALLLDRQEQNAPPPQAPLPQKSLPKIKSQYTNYLGFCYSEDPLGSKKPIRGDLVLFGRSTQQGPLVSGALYRVRGPTREDALVEITGGRGFQTVRSRPLPVSRGWKKVDFQSRLPRLARWNSGGEFAFRFEDGLLGRSCSWEFKF